MFWIVFNLSDDWRKILELLEGEAIFLYFKKIFGNRSPLPGEGRKIYVFINFVTKLISSFFVNIVALYVSHTYAKVGAQYQIHKESFLIMNTVKILTQTCLNFKFYFYCFISKYFLKLWNAPSIHLLNTSDMNIILIYNRVF